MSLRVISYNVLCSHLVDPERFVYCSESDLNSERRLSNVEEILRTEIEKKSIICLQEVSQTWASRFHVFFSSKGYHMINSQYSSRYSNYMGVALAYPRDTYKLLDCRFVNPFHSRIAPPPEPGMAARFLERALTFGGRFLVPALVAAPLFLTAASAIAPKLAAKSGMCKLLPLYVAGTSVVGAQAIREQWFPTPEKFSDPNLLTGIDARHRDILPMLRLQAVGIDDAGWNESRPFWISSTHMPCKFWNRKLMAAFAWHIVKQVEQVAVESGDPYILTGDFNMTPSDAGYEMISKGALPTDHQDFPTFPGEPEWLPILKPMRSAYCHKNGSEPEFTNYAHIQLVPGVEEDPFIETLDYIWLSEEWVVEAVDDTPTKEELVSSGVKSWPDATHPSDHLMLGTSIRMNSLK